MNDTTSNKKTTTDFEEPVYFRAAAELITDMLALAALVEQRRPEISALPGMLHFMVDTRDGVIEISKTTPVENESGIGRRHIVVERIAVNPRDSSTFGASVLETKSITMPPRGVH